MHMNLLKATLVIFEDGWDEYDVKITWLLLKSALKLWFLLVFESPRRLPHPI